MYVCTVLFHYLQYRSNITDAHWILYT